MAIFLKIIKNGQVQLIKLKPNSPLTLEMQEGELYQLVDESGEMLNMPAEEQDSQTIISTSNGEQVILLHPTNAIAYENGFILSHELSNIATISSTSTISHINGGILLAGGALAVLSSNFYSTHAKPQNISAISSNSDKPNNHLQTTKPEKTDDDAVAPTESEKTDNNAVAPTESEKTDNNAVAPTEPEKVDDEVTSPTEPEKTDDDVTSPTEPEKTDDDVTSPTEPENTDDEVTSPTEPEKTDDDVVAPTEPEKTDEDVTPPTEPEKTGNDVVAPTELEKTDDEVTSPTEPEKMDDEVTSPTEPEKTDDDVTSPTEPENTDDEVTSPTEPEKTDDDVVAPTEPEKTDEDVTPPTEPEKTGNDVVAPTELEKTDDEVTSPTEPEKMDDDVTSPTEPEKTDDDVVAPTEPEKTDNDAVAPTEPEKTNNDVVAPTEPEKTDNNAVVPTEPEKVDDEVTSPTEPENTDDDVTSPTEPEKTDDDVTSPTEPEKTDDDVTSPTEPENTDYDVVAPTEPEKTDKDVTPPTESEKTDDDVTSPTEPEKTDDDVTSPTEPENTDDDVTSPTEPENTDDDVTSPTEPEKTDNNVVAPTEPEKVDDDVTSPTEPEKTDDDVTSPTEPEKTDDDVVAPTEPEKVDDEVTSPTEPEKTDDDVTSPTEPEKTDNDVVAPTEPENTDDEVTSPTESEKTDNNAVAPTEPENTDDEVTSPTEPEKTDDEVTSPTEPEKTDDEVTSPTEPEKTDNNVVEPTKPEKTDNDVVAPTEPENTDDEVTSPTEPEKTDNEVTSPTEPEKTDNGSVAPTEPEKTDDEVVTPTAPKETEDNKILLATLNFNPITGDDIINAEEASRSLTVSGSVQNLQENDRLSLKIGEVVYPATVEGERFTAQVSGETLAKHAVISAEVVRGESVVASDDRRVEVKTDLPTAPTVRFNAIADDNIINLAESKGEIAVSGTIENAKEGEEVIVSCGCPTCSGVQWIDVKTTVQAGGFSVKFANGELLKEGFSLVKARVSTADQYGNKATGEGSQSYEVDIEPPKPSLIFDPISPINQATAETIKISGKVINLQASETGTVTATVGNQNYTAQIQDGSYEFSVPKAQFAGGNKVALRLNVADRAGNTAELTASENEQNQSYQYDVTLNKPTIVIEPVQTVNKATQTVRFSGTLDYDSDVNPNLTEVAIIINGTAHKATVQGKNWALELPASQLNSTQGERPFSVTAKVQDQLGNQAEATTASNFTVDTIAPTLQIELDDIAPIPNQGEKVVILGTVSGEVKPAFVTLIINAQEKQVAVQENGKFSTEIDRLQLVQSAEHQVSVRAESQDEAGNASTATANKGYTLVPNAPTTTGEVEITLNHISSDNHLNVSEAKTQTTLISGQVSGEGVQAGQEVTLTLGTKSVKAVLDGSFQFSQQVNTADLVQNGSYQVQAAIHGKTISRGYTVAEQATNQIQITEIGEQFTLNPASETVRIGGTLRLDGVAAKYHNDLFIDTVQVSLNGKTYTAGLGKARASREKIRGWWVDVKDKDFSFDIPIEELRAAKGKTMTFSLPSDHNVIYDEKRGAFDDALREIQTHRPRIDDQNKYTLNANPWLQGKTIVTNEPNEMTTVKGTVSGNAKVDDVVEVQIGDKKYTGKVEENNQFSVSVEKSALQKHSIEQITATLKGKDYANKAIEVSDVSRYQGDHQTTSGEFVAKFDTAQPEIPYFLNSIRFYDYNSRGLLGRHQIGQDDYKLTYHFVSDSNVVEFTQAQREMIRKVFDEIASHTRITFTEKETVDWDNGDRVDLRFYMLSSSGRSYADYGSAVNFRGLSMSESHYKSSYATALHETLHALGATHLHDAALNIGNEDSLLTSVMSYNLKMSAAKEPLRVLDQIYLHYRYGVNPEQRKGNDTYTFKQTTSYTQDGNSYIWDGAGVDTFDASMENKAVFVDLTPGSWIYRGAKTEKFWADETKEFNGKPNAFFGNTFYKYDGTIIPNVMDYNEDQAFIGYGTQIERLIGSRQNDELKGNVADNDIFGGDGDDKIWGNAGNDYLDGGKGIDTMHGGLGDDIFVVDNERDEVIEVLNEGKDTVLSYVNYRLSENVENLELLGNAIEGHGNDLANRITGNSSENLLSGGKGADIFVFNSPLNGNVDKITDFDISEDKIELAKDIFALLQDDNVHQYLHYDSKSGELSYGISGDSIVFAELPINLDSENIQFIIA